MKTRYTSAELLRIVEEADREQRREMVEREVAARLKQAAPPPPPPEPPRRSQMTAKTKSDFITKHGSAAYFALPW